jgi:hypothetical protein
MKYQIRKFNFQTHDISILAFHTFSSNATLDHSTLAAIYYIFQPPGLTLRHIQPKLLEMFYSGCNSTEVRQPKEK